MCYIRPEDKISAEELKIRLKLKSIRECLQDKRLQWFGHLERMEESAWSSKCKTFEVSGIFPRGRPRKTWHEIVKKDPKERKVSEDIARDRNA